jgi:rhamnose transport system permease protein
MRALFKNREVWLIVAIAALIALVATRFPGFARPGNLATVFNDT